MHQTNLETNRLLLRPLKPQDAFSIQMLINHPEIADMTSQIPYPYPLELAQQWISVQKDNWIQKEGIVYGIILKDIDSIIGVVSIKKLKSDRPILGYWLGKDFWGCGYATEAVNCLCEYSFNQLNIETIFACHLQRNPSSRKVLIKVGFYCLAENLSVDEEKNSSEKIFEYILSVEYFKKT